MVAERFQGLVCQVHTAPASCSIATTRTGLISIRIDSKSAGAMPWWRRIWAGLLYVFLGRLPMPGDGKALEFTLSEDEDVRRLMILSTAAFLRVVQKRKKIKERATKQS